MSGKAYSDFDGQPDRSGNDPSLPFSWCWTTVEELSTVVRGGSPRPAGDPRYFGGPVPWITVGSLTADEQPYLRATVEGLTEAGKERSRWIAPQTLLLTNSGATLGVPKISLIGGCINDGSVALLNVDYPLKLYLYYFLKSQTEYLRAINQGAAQPNLNTGIVKAISVPLSPLNEQRRIVAKVDELFSELDAGVAALKRVQANLKRYRSAVLKAAVEGRLTEEWRTEHQPTETGSQLLARILKERRAKWEADQLASFAAARKSPPKGWQAKYKEPAAPDTSDLPPLPKGWCWASVEQLASRSEYGTSAKCDYGSQGIPVIRIPNIASGYLTFDDIKRATKELVLEDGDELTRGDVLMCRTNGSVSLIGKTAVVRNEMDEDYGFASYLLRFRFVESANLPFWFQSVATSSYGRRFIESHAASSAGQHNISLTLIHGMLIPLPPLAEQEVMVPLIDSLATSFASTEKACEFQLKRADRLRQSILKQAFEGKLVPQDPSDEPATVLLARIRQQRAISPATSSSPVSKPKKVPKDVFVRRAEIVSYIVNRLATRRSFGRTQLEKTLHLAQSHLGLDLQFAFERYKAGPFDKDIYKIEGVAKKQGWFTEDEPANGKVTYHPGNKIEPMCQSAIRQLADKRAAFDSLLDHIAGMNTDDAELFATAYAAWNDLLIDGRTADDAAIVAEVHGWHEQKKRFTPTQIQSRLAWMRKCGYVPIGKGERTRLASPATSNRRAESKGKS